MAKYGKNNYFDGVVLPEPKEEALRRMAKGVNASEGYLSVASDMGMTGDNLSVVSAFRAPEPNGKAQYVTTLVRDNHRYSLWMETRGHFYCGTGRGSQSLHLGDLAAGTDHLVALCRDGDTLYCYLDGELKGTLGVYDFVAADGFFVGRAAINQDTLFTSTIYGAKVFNYALSAAEVSALYNNGDPEGYKLPSNYKGYGDVYHSDFSEGADGWHVILSDYVTMTAADGVITISKDDANRNMNIARSHNPYDSRVVDYFVRLEFAEPLPSEITNIVARPFNTIAGINLTISSDRLSASGTFINSGAKPNGGSMIIFQGSGAVSVSVSSISFTPAVCVAEYLPQNLIPTAEGSVVQWLDSAPQLPEANGILPPLDASVGGYDLAAIGNPKIIV